MAEDLATKVGLCTLGTTSLLSLIVIGDLVLYMGGVSIDSLGRLELCSLGTYAPVSEF